MTRLFFEPYLDDAYVDGRRISNLKKNQRVKIIKELLIPLGVITVHLHN